MPEPKIAIRKLSDFRPLEANPNRHTQRGLRALEDSVQEDGWVAPVTVAADGESLDGAARLEVAADRFNDEALVVEHDGRRPVIMIRTDVPDAKTTMARRIVYRANRVASLDLDWSAEQVLADLDASVDLSGLWDKGELDELLKGIVQEEPPEDSGPQIDRAAELQEKWGTALGQIWQLGEHRLAVGDCTDRAVVERLMQGEKAGAVVTDSPYGIERDGIENDDPEGLRRLFDGVLATMPIKNGVVINFQSPRLFPVWLDAIRAAGHKFERMLWMYKPPDETFPWRGWLLKSEAILVSSLGKAEWLSVHPYAHDTYILNTVGKENIPARHASIKPIAVVQDLIARVGGDVFDPFAGSGTTVVACQNLGRKCRAIEIHPPYVAICLERMATAFPDLEIERTE